MNKKTLLSRTALLSMLATGAYAAEPDYRTIHMQIDVNKPAAEVWSKVGGYCDIAAWLKLDCKITSGEGDVGTVRSLAGGRVDEILIAKTELGYGYTQPAVPVLQPLSRLHGSPSADADELANPLHAGARRIRQGRCGGEGRRCRTSPCDIRERAEEHEADRRGWLSMPRQPPPAG
jgi:hypothetical protein